MSKRTLDDALLALGRADPSFTAEIRRRLAPVKDRFFKTVPAAASEHLKDGLHAAPAYLTDPALRTIAMELAEFAIERGIDLNLPYEADGRTLLHEFVLLRDAALAVEVVTWFLAHGADPNRSKDDGETPYRLALRYGRTEVAEVLRSHGAY
jgi:ankyrin repeat protein